MFKHRGFSLIELVIVMGLSLTMIVVLSGIYAQRKTVSYDNAAQQIASTIQGVYVNSTQGLGPSSSTGFNTGDTFYGEAIQFINNSGTNPCMKVYKLKMDTGGNISSYESSDVKCPEGFMFDTSSATNGNSYVVIKNISGLMYSTGNLPTSNFDGSNGNIITNNSRYYINTGIPGSKSVCLKGCAVYVDWVSSKDLYSLTVSPNLFGASRK